MYIERHLYASQRMAKGLSVSILAHPLAAYGRIDVEELGLERGVITG